MINDNEYYVYCLVDPRTNEIFYIGKGKRKRAEQHFKEMLVEEKGNHDKIKFIDEIKKANLEVSIYYFVKEVNEEAAYFLEEILIDRIGRKFIGYGPLTNLLVGGIKEDKLKLSLEEDEKTTVQFAISKYPFLAEIIEQNPRTTKEDFIKKEFSKAAQELIEFVLGVDINFFEDLKASEIKFLRHPSIKAIQFECEFGHCELSIDTNKGIDEKGKSRICFWKENNMIFETGYNISFNQVLQELKCYTKSDC